MEKPAAPFTLDELLADIVARRGEIEALRRIPSDIVAGLRGIGLFRAAVPESLGGDARPLTEILQMVERLSQADGSVGWVASFAPQSVNYLGAMAPHRLRQIYAGGPDVVTAGGLFPLQPVERVSGGLRVDGTWRFGSGCQGADWISVGVAISGEGDRSPPPRMVVLPAAKVDIVENWETIGLSGTGSHDLVVRGVVVEEDWSFIRGGANLLDETICRFPAMPLAALCFSVVGLGIARAALEEIYALAGKRSITGAPRLADRSYVRATVAEAEVRLQAARGMLYDRVEAAWYAAAACDTISLEERAMLRLAANHASRSSVAVVQSCFELAGTTGIFLANPLQRFLRDVLVVNQHAFLGENHYESAGRILFDGTSEPGFP